MLKEVALKFLNLLGDMAKKRYIDIEVDKLTNSIVNIISQEVFETEFAKVSSKEIKKSDWLFDWHKELKDKNNQVYKMTTVENKTVVQGLISLTVSDKYVFVNIVENAKFNRGKQKMYLGVGGNMFAFACKISRDMGFDGYVGFVAKTALIEYYNKTLGAQLAIGQRMFIGEAAANELIIQYFKK